MIPLVLSVFPGIDLLGRGFEAEGFCVVRGPDLLWGSDIRDFHPPSGYFVGVISGSPCQDFSRLRRTPPTGYGLEMLHEFTRVVTEAAPEWWLLENVATLPNLQISGYSHQRLDLNSRECGMQQSRLRHIQFGSLQGMVLVPQRQSPQGDPVTICLASEGKRPNERRSFSDFCELQGLPRDFNLPGMSIAARYAAVGNGVPIPMARVLAAAVRDAHLRTDQVRLCACGCGRILRGKQQSATSACRKRLERRRKCVATERSDRYVTFPAQSLTRDLPVIHNLTEAQLCPSQL